MLLAFCLILLLWDLGFLYFGLISVILYFRAMATASRAAGEPAFPLSVR